MTCKFREQAENHENHPRRSWALNHMGNPRLLLSVIACSYLTQISKIGYSSSLNRLSDLTFKRLSHSKLIDMTNLRRNAECFRKLALTSASSHFKQMVKWYSCCFHWKSTYISTARAPNMLVPIMNI